MPSADIIITQASGTNSMVVTVTLDFVDWVPTPTWYTKISSMGSPYGYYAHLLPLGKVILFESDATRVFTLDGFPLLSTPLFPFKPGQAGTGFCHVTSLFVPYGGVTWSI